MRPSPTESATSFNVGTFRKGNDGNWWQVQQASNGVQRWVRANVPFQPLNLSSTMINPFEVGDIVEVVKSGSGCGQDEMGIQATVTELGMYYPGIAGVKVHPHIGNTKSYIENGNKHTSFHSGFIACESFKLVIRPMPAENSPQTFKLNQNMSKLKTINKKSAQEVRSIDTSLINKEEVFKMLALAESTGLPLLLVGQPGVAKTKSVLDYAKAWLNRDGKMSAADFNNKIYILETDEGTKASEIKGMPALDKLFTENQYEIHAPIADAEIVIINEVDKASSAIRNAMLGVMNEKFLFNGKNKIPCKWKLFVATCNEIPKEEANSPFWDRFMLKHTVNRVSAGELVKYYNKGAREYKESYKIGIPTKAEINAVEIPTNKLEKYLEVGYQHSSDRTLTFVPTLTKAVSYIWDVSTDKALVKTAQIMISQNAGSELQNKLMSPEVKTVMSKVEMLHSYTSNEQLELAVAEIESLINTYTSRNMMDEGQVEEIEMSMQYIISTHPARKDYQTSEEFDQMIAESVVSDMPVEATF
jgi:MoxR-like ATPase